MLPLILSFFIVIASLTCCGLSLTKPLLSLEGFYELHLFPQADRFDYQVSELHYASQILHILALMLMIATACLLILNIIAYYYANEWSLREKLLVITCILIGFGLASYIAAFATLAKVGIDYKRLADHIPLIHPKVAVELGGYMEIFGLVGCALAFMFVFAGTVAAPEGYVAI